MFQIILKAAILFCVILLGNLLNVMGVFSREKDFSTISKLIVYVTLPSAIITKLNNIDFHYSFLLLSVFGFACNWIYIFVSKYMGKTRSEQSFLALNINGYNIGNFALPFISYFLDGLPILFVSLFDAGSSLMVSSGNYAVAKEIKYGGKDGELDQGNLRDFVQTTLTSPAVLTYIVMITLSILSISLPSMVIEFTSIMGDANTFLSMFMIGIALNLRIDESKMASIGKILAARYGVATVLSGIIYFIIPLSMELKQTLIIVLFAPMASLMTLFTETLGEDVELSAQVNSASIIISVIIMSLLLSVWG